MNNALVLNNEFQQRNENARNGHQALLLKISKSNEKLKRANRRLKKKVILRQKLLANYELRLAKSMADLFALRKELAKLKEVKESDNARIENLVGNVKRLKRKLLHLQRMDMEWNHDEFSIKVRELKQEIYKVGKIHGLKGMHFVKDINERKELEKEKTELKQIEEENEKFQQSIKNIENRLAEIVPVNANFEMDFMETEHFLSEPSKTSE
ncbi:uncharacterized protein LOC129968626 isoform X2 [Argiope bruennichi]|nr:uncharacterized protein LOC129968626 isoform X2 [Argiope bruennichi]KAF8793082.1 hypothetical protein HNY73_004609 [Argiope bruennichi]